MWGLSKKQAEKVAKEKQRASRAMGDSPAKAWRYGQEVRDYASKERRRKDKG